LKNKLQIWLICVIPVSLLWLAARVAGVERCHWLKQLQWFPRGDSDCRACAWSWFVHSLGMIHRLSGQSIPGFLKDSGEWCSEICVDFFFFRSLLAALHIFRHFFLK
jgi:hypothetical protein